MNIMVVDLETGQIDTSKSLQDLENNVICEIGIANLDLDSGSIKPVFSQICKEDIAPNPKSWVFECTSLTCKQVSESNHFNEFKEQLQDIFNDNLVTSWGHDFDLANLEHRGLVIARKFWDPKRTLTNFLKIPSSEWDGFKWPKVTEAYQYFYGKPMQQTHRAVDDAIVEAEIILKATEKWPSLKDNWKHFTY